MTKEELLNSPSELIKKKPFFRGYDREYLSTDCIEHLSVGQEVVAKLPQLKKRIVTQDLFATELDQFSHSVLYDGNVPALCMKLDDGSFQEIKFEKLSVPIQQMLVNKQTLHLSANPMDFTLMDTNPTPNIERDFTLFKQYWNLRNQDGLKTKMVATQKSYGDAGLLYYFNSKKEIKSRILSYEDGFVLCPHNDDNGERILESVYYISDNVEYIDCYDDKYMYRYKKSLLGNLKNDGWTAELPQEHGFDEIPLITKRGDVAWNKVQSAITSYEVLYNIFMCIQRRFGWGILYVRGNIDQTGKKIAGAVVLNDRSASETNSDAKFLSPPSPQGVIETLELLEETIQKGSGTTFILPKDVKANGDVSGVAIMQTQSLDIENALQGVIDWQNVADKMVRLFKQGLAKELVHKGINSRAITEFANLNINAKFKIWRPYSETEYNNMLIALKNSEIISQETATELSTVSRPDENTRLEKQRENNTITTQTTGTENGNETTTV